MEVQIIENLFKKVEHSNTSNLLDDPILAGQNCLHNIPNIAEKFSVLWRLWGIFFQFIQIKDRVVELAIELRIQEIADHFLQLFLQK